EQLHAEDVQFLPPHVFAAHVHDAVVPHQGTHGGGRYPMLPGTGFGDDAAFAHAPGQQSLAKTVVDFVRAGMQQIFALEVHARSAQLLRQSPSEKEWSWTSGVIPQKGIELLLKRDIVFRRFVCALQLVKRRHERFGNLAAAVRAEASCNCRSRRRHMRIALHSSLPFCAREACAEFAESNWRTA